MNLPAWNKTLEELKLERRVLPRDVRTRWNSTFRLLKVALEYKEAVDRITGDKKLGLRKFEIGEDEWAMVKQLAEVLEVSVGVGEGRMGRWEPYRSMSAAVRCVRVLTSHQCPRTWAIST